MVAGLWFGVWDWAEGFFGVGFSRQKPQNPRDRCITHRPLSSSLSYGLYLEPYKVIPKRTYLGAYGYTVSPFLSGSAAEVHSAWLRLLQAVLQLAGDASWEGLAGRLEKIWGGVPKP